MSVLGARAAECAGAFALGFAAGCDGLSFVGGFRSQRRPWPVLEALGMQLAFTSAGAALAAAVMAFPLIVRAIRLALEAVDPRLEEAAGTLGASPIKVFAFVTLPLILPGLVAGAVVGFAKALGEFGATITFVSNIPGETQTLASAIYAVLQVPGQEAAVGRMIVLSLLLSFGALVLSEILARKMVRR
jgi:molybdate transport system permease protein